MRILILSANTGQGHNSCAKAIQEACSAHGDSCEIVDVFALVSEKLSNSISKKHAATYRKTPRLSNAGYNFLEKHPTFFDQNHFIYRVMSKGRKKAAAFITQGSYEAVICTHVLAAMILTAAIQKEDIHVHSAFVATDYSCPPGINGTMLDLYFIPYASLTEDFLRAGVPASKIVTTGIPVQKAFSPAEDKAYLKEKMGLNPHYRHLLIMCGSMGCGPIPHMLHTLQSSMPPGWEITVVCGTNEALKAELEADYSNHSAIHVRGYERQMPALLSSADLYLTKPGGLSISEAAAAAIPMVLINAVSGCEENNLRCFVKAGFAVAGETAAEAAELCVELMEDPAEIERMANRLREHAPAGSAERIHAAMTKSAANP